MYSPKIPERLIRPLYQMAQRRRQPMTRIVAEILDAYLMGQITSDGDSLVGSNRHDPAERNERQSPA